MKAKTITAKLRDAVPVCLIVEGDAGRESGGQCGRSGKCARGYSEIAT